MLEQPFSPGRTLVKMTISAMTATVLVTRSPPPLSPGTLGRLGLAARLAIRLLRYT